MILAAKMMLPHVWVYTVAVSSFAPGPLGYKCLVTAAGEHSAVGVWLLGSGVQCLVLLLGGCYLCGVVFGCVVSGEVWGEGRCLEAKSAS